LIGTLSSRNEHHISLADVRVAILQEEHLIDTIILKGRELDEYAYWTSQALLKYQILLPTNLQAAQVSMCLAQFTELR